MDDIQLHIFRIWGFPNLPLREQLSVLIKVYSLCSDRGVSRSQIFGLGGGTGSDLRFLQRKYLKQRKFSILQNCFADRA